VFDELEGAEKIVPEQVIFEARNVRCDLGATQPRQERKRVARESNVIALFAGVSKIPLTDSNRRPLLTISVR
jgi:hypothetical protein